MTKIKYEEGKPQRMPPVLHAKDKEDEDIHFDVQL
jgi:hypothetical protein